MVSKTVKALVFFVLHKVGIKAVFNITVWNMVHAFELIVGWEHFVITRCAEIELSLGSLDTIITVINELITSNAFTCNIIPNKSLLTLRTHPLSFIFNPFFIVLWISQTVLNWINAENSCWIKSLRRNAHSTFSG